MDLVNASIRVSVLLTLLFDFQLRMLPASSFNYVLRDIYSRSSHQTRRELQVLISQQ
jgi:hypothetical protein